MFKIFSFVILKKRCILLFIMLMLSWFSLIQKIEASSTELVYVRAMLFESKTDSNGYFSIPHGIKNSSNIVHFGMIVSFQGANGAWYSINNKNVLAWCSWSSTHINGFNSDFPNANVKILFFKRSENNQNHGFSIIPLKGTTGADGHFSIPIPQKNGVPLEINGISVAFQGTDNAWHFMDNLDNDTRCSWRGPDVNGINGNFPGASVRVLLYIKDEYKITSYPFLLLTDRIGSNRIFSIFHGLKQHDLLHIPGMMAAYKGTNEAMYNMNNKNRKAHYLWNSTHVFGINSVSNTWVRVLVYYPHTHRLTRDLAVEDWCYAISGANNEITFYPIIKNTGNVSFRSDFDIRYKIGTTYDSVHKEVTGYITTWPEGGLRPGKTLILDKGCTWPFKIKSDKRYSNIGQCVLSAYYKDDNWVSPYTDDNMNNNGNYPTIIRTGEQITREFNQCGG